MSYMITQTLISSWRYVFSCHEEYQQQAYDDFLVTLRHEHKPATPEMQNGLDFEAEVYKEAAGETREQHPKWEDGIKAVATRLTGARVQVRASRKLTIGSTELLVYGVLDALKAGVIYDVKFSNTSFGSADLAGKYLDSPQHPAYFYIVPEATEFQYLVSDGKDLYTEIYTPKITRPFPEIAEEFLNSIRGMGLMEVYKEHYAV